jgi:phage terminase large subunit-like protein
MSSRAKQLAQLKLDASNSDWGVWCKHWDRDPRDMHPNDERALLDGCYFDILAANRIHQFFEERCTLPDRRTKTNPLGIKPFILHDWWFRDILGPLFGWKRRDDRRRFDKGFITTAKKSGKSTVLAGLPAYMITADGEDQASIIFEKSARMVQKSPQLNKRLKITPYKKRIYDQRTGSWYEALSTDADSADGKNPHLLIVDEIHRWKNRAFFDALMYGDVSREQALFLMITTAGEALEGVGYEEFELARALCDPHDESYIMSHFAAILQANPDRSWDDPEGWKEANPTIVEDRTEQRIAKLQARCDTAKLKPADKRKFMRFICNWWVEDVVDTFIDPEIWRLGKRTDIKPAKLAACGLGLDLSSTIDITACCKATPHKMPKVDESLRDSNAGSASAPPDHDHQPKVIDGFYLEWMFWMPADTIIAAEERDRQPYREWADAGYIQLTPGSRVQYQYVRRWISGVELDEEGGTMPIRYSGAVVYQNKVKGIGYDRWCAESLVAQLSDYDGLTMLEVGQGYKDSSPACKRFRELAVDKALWHNNPVADYMIRYCKNDEDPAGNIKLNKKKSRRRIDGIAAGVMAIFAYEKSPETAAWTGEGTGTWD